jgi:hypothetical protein
MSDGPVLLLAPPVFLALPFLFYSRAKVDVDGCPCLSQAFVLAERGRGVGVGGERVLGRRLSMGVARHLGLQLDFDPQGVLLGQ